MTHSLARRLLAALVLSACSGSTTGLTGAGPDAGGASDAATGDSGVVVVTPEDGSTPEDAATPLGDGSASQACADWAAARCQRFNACSDMLYVPIHYGDEATCQASSVQTCTIGLAATGTAATPETYEACAAALPSESCADFLGDNPVAACAALAGSVATGAPCVGSSQCQSTYCAVPEFGTCGVCATVPKAGDPCSVTADCGSRNSLTCTANVCVAYGQLNSSCSDDAPCGIGLDCVGAKKTTPGTCETTVSEVGSTCDPNRATGPSCDPTLELTCDTATKTCVQNTVVNAGATCGAVDGGEARCSASGTCVIPTLDGGPGDAGPDSGDAGPGPVQTTGTCLGAAASGSGCDSVAGPACLPPAKCVITTDAGTSGTCEVANPATCQ